MSNLRTHFGKLTDEEFARKRRDVLEAIRAVGTENGERNIEEGRTNDRVILRIVGISVDSTRHIKDLMDALGPDATWMSDAELENDRKIAA